VTSRAWRPIGAPGRTTVLCVVIREEHTSFGNSVDIGSLVAHNSLSIGADVGLTDVVAKNDENVWLFLTERRQENKRRQRKSDHDLLDEISHGQFPWKEMP
jgi:hypothetical protein